MDLEQRYVDCYGYFVIKQTSSDGYVFATCKKILGNTVAIWKVMMQ